MKYTYICKNTLHIKYCIFYASFTDVSLYFRTELASQLPKTGQATADPSRSLPRKKTLFSFLEDEVEEERNHNSELEVYLGERYVFIAI